jgi:hypothetical protein
MSTTTPTVSRTAIRAGRIVTAIPVAFLIFDVVMKFMVSPEVAQATREIGWDPAIAPTLGVVLGACLALYVWPRTAVLGAVLLTGYLGGAVATHVRVANPLFTHVLFPTYVGALLWIGLYLRDSRVRALLRRPRATAGTGTEFAERVRLAA